MTPENCEKLWRTAKLVNLVNQSQSQSERDVEPYLRPASKEFPAQTAMVGHNVVPVPVDMLETVEIANQEFLVGSDPAIKESNAMTLKMDSSVALVPPDIMAMANAVNDDEAVKVAHATQVRDPDSY